MVKIEATVDRFSLDTLSDALQEAGVTGLTVSEVRVPAADAGPRIYRGSLHGLFRTMLRIEVVVPAERMEGVLEAISATLKATATEQSCVVVTPVSEAVQIRTGLQGPGVIVLAAQ
jgi:nitrogen regulatory protein PII